MSLPKQEYEDRISRTLSVIENSNLDFLFIYFDEYNVMNGRYLTGWCPSVERGAVIVSHYRDPFLIGGPEAGPYAEMDSAIKTIVSSRLFMVPEEEYPGAEILSFAQILEKYFSGRRIKRIGIVGINTIPHTIYSRLADELIDAEIIDSTDEFEKLRYVKSSWEIEMIKKAYEAADKGFQALLDAMRDGKKEYEAAAEAEYEARKLGCEGWGYRTIIGAAERSRGIIPPASDRVFHDGEMVLTGIAPRYNGYNATACCPVVVGNKPNDIQKKWMKDVFEALHVTKEACKPGMIGKEIDNIPRSFLINKGYGDYMPMPFVHSSGLCEYEKPFFGPSSNDELKVNQFICIDIAMFGNKDIPGIRAETGYLVTEKGLVPFSTYMKKLFGF